MGMKNTLFIFLFVSSLCWAEHYQIDSKQSNTHFRVGHPKRIRDTTGFFRDIEGHFQFSSDKPSENYIEVKIRVASIDTGNEARDSILKSKDFFLESEFPLLTFRSTEFQKHPQKKSIFFIKGKMSIRGVTRTISCRARHLLSINRKDPKRRGFRALFTIKRSDFGMMHALNLIDDEVRIKVYMHGLQKTPAPKIDRIRTPQKKEIKTLPQKQNEGTP